MNTPFRLHLQTGNSQCWSLKCIPIAISNFHNSPNLSVPDRIGCWAVYRSECWKSRFRQLMRLCALNLRNGECWFGILKNISMASPHFHISPNLPVPNKMLKSENFFILLLKNILKLQNGNTQCWTLKSNSIATVHFHSSSNLPVSNKRLKIEKIRLLKIKILKTICTLCVYYDRGDKTDAEHGL